MSNQILVGVAAGIASALLYGSLAGGTPLAMVLFYIAALPLFIAAIGWGWATALVGALAAMAASFPLAGASGTLLFALAVCAPAVGLGYLANLSRASSNGSGALEWYPVGRLIAWTAVISGLLLLPSLFAFNFSLESYEASIREAFTNFLESSGNAGELPEDLDPEALTSFFVNFVPPVSVIVWIAMTLFNLYLAGRIVQFSGRLARPWPDLKRLELPRELVAGLAVALVVSFVPGIIGLLSGAFAAGFLFAFMLQGLAVMHVLTLPSKIRPLILGGVYFVLIFLGWSGTVLSWSGFLLALLGLAEPVFRLRAQVPPGTGGPGGTGGRGGPPAPRNDNPDNRNQD